MTHKNNFWCDKRIFITGHTGFKGSWLDLYLIELGATNIKGYSIDKSKFYTDIKKSIRRNNNSFIDKKGDICNSRKLKREILSFKPDIIFHMAAQPLVSEGYKNPQYTWATNCMGTVHLLDAIRDLKKKCVVIVVTTDKVYKNNESGEAFKESDELGGLDIYSASKSACEIITASYQYSFFDKLKHLKVATVRAGNVLGGGDWSQNRIVPDIIKSLRSSKNVLIRSPKSVRPWQHVLDPLSGYIRLAEYLYHYEGSHPLSFNFGPDVTESKTVEELVQKILSLWPGSYEIIQNDSILKESKLLTINSSFAKKELGWSPVFKFEDAVETTVNWYKNYTKEDAYMNTLGDIKKFLSLK